MYDDALNRYLISLEARIEALERAQARPRSMAKNEDASLVADVAIEQTSGEQALKD
jgi:hypothetical protein